MVVAAFLDHIIGPLPPEVKLDRTLSLMTMAMRSPNGGGRSGAPGYAFLDRYVRTLPNAERVSLFTEPQTAISYKDGAKIESWLKRTDGEFWQILEFDFLEGGPFTVEDEKNANFVAVINEATRRKFFGDQSALGKTIDVDGQNFHVVGVVPNVPFFRLVPFADIWVPISTSKSTAYRHEIIGNFIAMILARSRADFDDIQQEFDSRRIQAQTELLDTKRYDSLTGGPDTRLGTISRMFFSPNRYDESSPVGLIAGIVILMVLFMLLPTINLININVSRILERASEIGVRKAFGASSWTLVGQFVVENVLLTLVGGVIGFIGALLVLRLISQSGLIPYAEFHLNVRIFLYGLLIAVFFGLFSGVYPAWKMSRLHPVEALRGRTR
jgi:putative ABC transport system permease protein